MKSSGLLLPCAICTMVAILHASVGYWPVVAAENDRVITDFEGPMVQFSYMAWEKTAEASDGLLSIRADGSRGGFGLNGQFDISDLAEHSPAIALTIGPNDASVGLNVLLRDENDASATFHFPMADVARGRPMTLMPRDGASFATPNRRGKDGKVLDLAKIKQIQVLGEWKGNKAIDVVVDRILAVAPNKEIITAREALQLRQQREAEMERQQLLERQRRIAEARKNVRHGVGCAEVVHVGAVDRDILAIEIQDGAYVHCRLEEYTEKTGDRIIEKKNKKTGEITSLLLKRDGVEVAEFVTKNRSHIRYHDGVQGEALVWEVIGEAAAYTISSSDDPAYAQAIAPLKVSRKSKPTAWARGNRQPTRHYAYLHLPSPLKVGATYTIRFESVSTRQPDVKHTHDPDQVRSEAVHVNQVGYRPDDPGKRAYLSIWLGDGGAYSYGGDLMFRVVDADSGRTVYTGQVQLAFAAGDLEKMKHEVNYNQTDVYTMDFSSVMQPGTYRVVVEDVGCSYPFSIGRDTWTDAYVAAMRGFYQHRTGIDIGPPHFRFDRPRNFREEDGVTFWELSDEPQNEDSLEVSTHQGVGYRTGRKLHGIWGGYHDAGDWDMHCGHLLASMGHMELLELCPDFFAQVEHNTPESGNAVPDCLEEALFNVRFARRMQKEDGSVRHGVEFDKQSNGTTKGPSWLVTDLVVYDSDPLSTLRFAACSARMSFLLKPYDATEAQQLEDASRKAVAHAEAHHESWPGRRVRGGELKKDERALRAWRAVAALELYRLTGDPQWHELFKRTTLLTDTAAVDGALDFMHDKHGFSAALYARMDDSKVDVELKRRAKQVLVRLAEMATEYSRHNAFGAAHPAEGMPLILGFWSAPFVVECVWAHYLTREDQYLQTIVGAQNFALGANPMNTCMTSGLGHVSATPLHRDTECTGQPMFEGIAPYGPHDWKYWGKGDNWATFGFIWHFSKECHPTGWAWPVTESYFDVRGFPAMTEHCIPHTMMRNSFVWGYLAGRK